MTAKTEEEPIKVQQDNSLAIVSLVLGVVSLNGMGLLTGIPAIVTAAIALKKQKPGRGLSIAGLVTGIAGTILSLIFIAFMIFMIVIEANTPVDRTDYRNNRTTTEQMQRL
jgi:hypothetical protein